MSLDLERLQSFDQGRLHDLDKVVDRDIDGEISAKKRAIEESRAKKRKKAQKARRQQELQRNR